MCVIFIISVYTHPSNITNPNWDIAISCEGKTPRSATNAALITFACGLDLDWVHVGVSTAVEWRDCHPGCSKIACRVTKIEFSFNRLRGASEYSAAPAERPTTSWCGVVKN